MSPPSFFWIEWKTYLKLCFRDALGLKRFQQSGQTHFVTFSCHHRRPLFTEASAKITFENALERVRLSFSAHIYGYVVMPEHVHLLISEPPQATLAEAIKSLKQGVARRLIAGADHFWQKRYYDFNIRDFSISGKASLHPPKSRRAETMRAPGGLGVEQLSPLRNRVRGAGAD